MKDNNATPLSDTLLLLGKVFIAYAWSDGKMTAHERTNLKDLLFQLPVDPVEVQGVTSVYLEWPVDNEEHDRLIKALKEKLKGYDVRQPALKALYTILKAEQVIVDEEEPAFISRLSSSIAKDGEDFTNVIEKLAQEALRKHEDSISVVGKDGYEHFMRELSKAVPSLHEHMQLAVSREKLMKLCLSGILMARIAHSDQEIDRRETTLIRILLQQKWMLREDQSESVAKLLLEERWCEADEVRACRQFYEMTTPNERRQFVDALFAIAHADGLLQKEESAEVTRIARLLRERPTRYDSGLEKFGGSKYGRPKMPTKLPGKETDKG